MRYEDMVHGLSRDASLSSQQAGVTLAATVQALGETAQAATENVRSQLPGELAGVEPAGRAPERSWDEFVVRVGEIAGIAEPEGAGDRVRAAIATLSEAVTAGQLRELVEALPPEFRDAVPGSIGLSVSAEALLAEVRKRSGADTLEQARELAEAVLGVLAEHSSAGQDGDLAARLPADFRDALDVHRAAPRTEVDEFLEEVAGRTGATTPKRAREDVGAVFTVLEQWAPDEVDQTVSQLPTTVAELAR